MPRDRQLTPTRRMKSKKLIQRSNEPPKPRLRRRLRPHRSRIQMFNAIKRSRGIWAILARNLGCTIVTAQNALRQEGWELLLEAFEDERLKARGMCVKRLYDIALYSTDDNCSQSALKFILEKTHPDFQRSQKVVVEGGSKPVQVQQVSFNFPPNFLQLPLDERVRILEMVEEKERELNGTD